MAVGVSKHKPRGRVGRAAARGQSVIPELEKAKNKYVANAEAAAPIYANKLGEYLNWYIPQIEAYAQAGMNNPNYFANNDAGQDARIENAVKVAQQTSKLAEMWRRVRRTGNAGAGAGAAVLNPTMPPFPYMSEEKVIKL